MSGLLQIGTGLYSVKVIGPEAPGTSGSGGERRRERAVSGALHARTNLLRSG